MKKIFTLAAAMLFCAGMFAAVETETFDQTGATNNTNLVKVASTLPGTYIAGQGGDVIKGYEPSNKGIKLRTIQTQVTINEVAYGYVVFNVHSGYAVRSIQMLGTTNGDAAATVKGLYVDVNTEDLATSLAAATNKLAADFVFPNKSTNYATSAVVTTDASSNIVLLFDVASQNQLRAIFITEYERTATCDDPTISWNVEPADGAVGATDFAASVNVPAGQTVTWESSVPAVATVENGTIHYVGFGVTTITAKYTYVGEDYCNIEASISKDILVPITYKAAGANDKIWYFQDAVPTENPVDGLTYPDKGTASGNGLFGIKLNSDGYAWFAKPAVAGKLRVGAYCRSGASAYEVNVFACNASGEKQGEALGALSTPHAGGISAEMNIAEDVAGLYINRVTSQEGILYFIEFREDSEATAIENTEAGVKAVKFFENGQLLIEKNGVIYNAQGAIVR